MEEGTSIVPEFAITPKEMEAMIACDSDVRYKYTLKRIARTLSLWTVGTEQYAINFMSFEDELFFPIWSSKEYADLFGAKYINGYTCMPIPLLHFKEHITDIIREKDILFSVFPTPEDGLGEVVELDTFINDLNKYLGEYHESFDDFDENPKNAWDRIRFPPNFGNY